MTDTVSQRLAEAGAITAAFSDTAPATRLADLAKAISATEAEILDLQTTLVAAHARINRLVDLKSRVSDLQTFGPGTKGELPDWHRKNDAVNAELRALSTTNG
jgi:hypothetical protein